MAVSSACAEHPDDPDALLAAIRTDLGLTEPELDELVADACGRYRTQQERLAVGDWSGEDLAELVRELGRGQGVDLLELRAAIDGVCP